MDASTFFEDQEPINHTGYALDQKSPLVVIKEGLLKVDQDGYSLAGVTSFKIETVSRLASYKPLLQMVICTCILVPVAWAVLYVNKLMPYAHPMQINDVFWSWVVVAAPWFFAVSGYNKFKVDRYSIIQLTLLGVRQGQKICIGYSRPDPSNVLLQRMKNTGYGDYMIDAWKRNYGLNQKRTQLISEAISSTLAQKATASV